MALLEEFFDTLDDESFAVALELLVGKAELELSVEQGHRDQPA